jgi:hypothetical protein
VKLPPNHSLRAGIGTWREVRRSAVQVVLSNLCCDISQLCGAVSEGPECAGFSFAAPVNISRN